MGKPIKKTKGKAVAKTGAAAAAQGQAKTPAKKAGAAPAMKKATTKSSPAKKAADDDVDMSGDDCVVADEDDDNASVESDDLPDDVYNDEEAVDDEEAVNKAQGVFQAAQKKAQAEDEEAGDIKIEHNPDVDPYLLKDAAYIKTDSKWRNKQRTLVFASRGVGSQHRHLMDDLKRIMPHAKEDAKFENNRQSIVDINEVAELKSCNNVVYFEARKSRDLYMWLARAPQGPSAKFQVLNIHTSGEVKLSGNCLMHSRPLLTFDAPFDDEKRPELKLLKEMLTQSFGAPRNHPKSKPFHDHVLSFFYYDRKIHARHYQISPLLDNDSSCFNDPERQVLTEIGPRFVLDPIRILDKSFGGQTLWTNGHYASPTLARKREREKTKKVLAEKRDEKEGNKKVRAELLHDVEDPTQTVFG